MDIWLQQNDPSLLLLMLMLRAPESFNNQDGVDLEDYEVNNKNEIHEIKITNRLEYVNGVLNSLQYFITFFSHINIYSGINIEPQV